MKIQEEIKTQQLGRCDFKQYEHCGPHERIPEGGQSFPPFGCKNWHADEPQEIKEDEESNEAQRIVAGTLAPYINDPQIERVSKLLHRALAKTERPRDIFDAGFSNQQEDAAQPSSSVSTEHIGVAEWNDLEESVDQSQELATVSTELERQDVEHPPFSPDEAIERLREVLRMLEAITDSTGKPSVESPLPTVRVYLRGIIGCGIANTRIQPSVASESEVELLTANGTWAKWAQQLGDLLSIPLSNTTFDLDVLAAVRDLIGSRSSVASARECAAKIREWIRGDGLVDANAINEVAAIIAPYLATPSDVWEEAIAIVRNVGKRIRQDEEFNEYRGLLVTVVDDLEAARSRTAVAKEKEESGEN